MSRYQQITPLMPCLTRPRSGILGPGSVGLDRGGTQLRRSGHGGWAGSQPGSRPNILLITSDEERYTLPNPDGFVLPARERLQECGVTFDRYYVASAQCSSSRSVIYTGQHMPLTEIYDNDNMPYIRPLDPALGTLGSMLRTAGYYCTYQGKWHLSRAYKDPNDPRPTTDALEPYGFSEFNDWGDLDGGAWAGLKNRSRHRGPSSQVAAQPGSGGGTGAAMVSGRQLRESPRCYEL
jgi:arylsulfatase A-like enzyme